MFNLDDSHFNLSLLLIHKCHESKEQLLFTFP